MQTDATSQSLDQSIALLKQSLGNDILSQLHLKESQLHIIGNGCVAQVLYGVTTHTNQPIAIKVLHPNIRDTIAVDIRILSIFAGMIEDLVPGGHNWSVRDAVMEFSLLMNSQLDMTEEAHRLDKFRHNFDHYKCNTSNRHINSKITFPKPMWPYITQNILIESYEEGIQASDVLSYSGSDGSNNNSTCSIFTAIHHVLFPDTTYTHNNSSNNSNTSDSNNSNPSLPLHQHQQQHSLDAEELSVLGQNKSLIAEIGLNTLLKMIFEDNFVHGDMHPGNLLLRYTPRPDKLHPLQASESLHDFPKLELIVLDAGIVSELQDQDKMNLFDLFKGI